MKKKVMGIIAIIAIAAVAGYNVYTSQYNVKLSVLALANVEALAQSGEYPDMEITCNQSKHHGGRCWHMYGDCYTGSILWDDCRFTGDMRDACITPCD
ncbi:NVEALA domain-containing protein [Bacteroides sp. GM023]|uniref:NVEALA domain-containing protein n=1 Tax=Bacteroides sp. GM023 TaxID=2723058 RepID=UPI00168BAF35|nr:NVEALA domain-containing protein [Bacteroides sp. GM023]MBD3589311.1 hypothetical protein [Bacteroides sp. GM023]